jgi:hypothetical protein
MLTSALTAANDAIAERRKARRFIVRLAPGNTCFRLG